MADQQDNQGSINILSVGLNQDSSPLSLDVGEYSYALNAGFDNLQGNANQINNYPSNELCITLKEFYVLIGSCKINTGHVLFSCDPSGNSEIGLLEDCTYTVLISDPCLGFQITKQIQCTYKETYNCGRRIYWTDNSQPRRFVDIDHIPYANATLKTVDCDAILIQPNLDYPCVWYYDLQEVGSLRAGMYKPYIQYADINGIGYTEWFESTGNIPIFNDVVNANFSEIEGSSVDEQTSKAILFYLSNLDTSYTHINIGILRTDTGIARAFKVATIPTSSTDYLLTSLITNNVVELTLDELFIQKTIYKAAKTVTQSNGYLLWGNLEGRKDPNFQPIANNIQVTWQVFKAPAYWTEVNSKNPHTTTYKKGYMRDEVYAFGIRLIYKDGSKSCAYHIPGRTLDHYSTGSNITIVPGVSLDQYGEIFGGGQLGSQGWDSAFVKPGSINHDNYSNNGVDTPRWKVYNTAYIHSGYAPGYITGAYLGQCAEFGDMAYWESGLLYPDTLAEDGVTRIFPTGYIRHHKMPDASVIPIFDDSTVNTIYGEPKLNYLGINVDNVQINYSDPDYADVIGWEIVVGDRANNKSIIAKGLLYNNWEAIQLGTNFAFPTNMYNDTNEYRATGDISPVAIRKDVFTFYSPDTTFRKANLTISEIKQESEHYGTASKFNTFTATYGTPATFGAWVGSYNFSTNPVFNNVRRDVQGITYAENNNYLAVTQFDLPLYNVHRTSSVYLQSAEGVGGASSEFFNFPTNVDNSHPYDGTLNLRNGVNISSFYASLKLIQINQYDQLDNFDYLSVGMCPVNNTYIHCLFGGDTFISNFTYFKMYDGTFYNVVDPDGNFVSVGTVCTNILDDSVNPPNSAVCITWIESSINTELRYGGTTPDQSYYNTFSISNPISWTQWFTGVSCIGDNYYAYNDDYSTLNRGKYICSQPLEDRIKCDTNYKTRCIYTLRSQEESKEDYWLVERPNDFYDFPKKSGAMWDMRELGQDKVLFRFENSIYAYPAYDTLETDANTIQLGTGGIFGQDPKELVTTDTGYGGTRSQWAINSTEFGHFFVDDKRGNVFKLQSNIEPISNSRMSNFFSKNLPLKLLNYFPEFVHYDNPANPEGIGFTSVFDDRFKTWLLTKKDYTPILDSNKVPLVRYVGDDFVVSDPITQRDRVVSLSETEYFCNESFTVGYNAKVARWVSFYSFIPDSYMTNSLSFFSVKDNGIWKHHADKYCKYYGEDYDHIIEYVVKFNGQITNKTSVQFITNTYENFGDGSFYELQFETFKQGILYNNEACTGLLNFVVPDNNNLSTAFNLPHINATSIDVAIEKAGKCVWRNSYLWNHVANRTVNNPIFLPSCTPSIDKDLNNGAINYNKSWFELARISQQWAKLRLFYPNTNYNIVTTLALNKSIPDFM